MNSSLVCLMMMMMTPFVIHIRRAYKNFFIINESVSYIACSLDVIFSIDMWDWDTTNLFFSGLFSLAHHWLCDALQYLYRKKDLLTSGLLLLWVEKLFFYIFIYFDDGRRRGLSTEWFTIAITIEWWWSILIVFDNHHHLVTTCFHVNAFPCRISGGKELSVELPQQQQ